MTWHFEEVGTLAITTDDCYVGRKCFAEITVVTADLPPITFSPHFRFTNNGVFHSEDTVCTLARITLDLQLVIVL